MNSVPHSNHSEACSASAIGARGLNHWRCLISLLILSFISNRRGSPTIQNQPARNAQVCYIFTDEPAHIGCDPLLGRCLKRRCHVISILLIPDLFARRGHKPIHLLGCCGIQVCGVRQPEERCFEQNPETRWITKGCHCHHSPFLSPREAEHRRYPYPCPAKGDVG